jgi:hypothetical protein
MTIWKMGYALIAFMNWKMRSTLAPFVISRGSNAMIEIKFNPIKSILIVFSIGKLDIALFNHWLGFGCIMGKRFNFGFIKFWYNRPIRRKLK